MELCLPYGVKCRPSCRGSNHLLSEAWPSSQGQARCRADVVQCPCRDRAACCLQLAACPGPDSNVHLADGSVVDGSLGSLVLKSMRNKVSVWLNESSNHVRDLNNSGIVTKVANGCNTKERCSSIE